MKLRCTKVLVITEFFREILTILNFAKMLQNFRFANIFAKIFKSQKYTFDIVEQSCPCFHILAILSCPFSVTSYPRCLDLLPFSGHPVLSFLSCLYYPNCPRWLSRLRCTLCQFYPPLMLPLSYLSCRILAILASFSCPG